jgi:hypothetical protein
MYPERMEVPHPSKKARVVQNYPNDCSTKKKITKAMTTQKMAMYLYSCDKKAFAPLSM